jgi:CheY-like chemotaxis protein
LQTKPDGIWIAILISIIDISLNLLLLMEDSMSIIDLIHRNLKARTSSQGISSTKVDVPLLITEEVTGVNEEFNLYSEYYMDMVRIKSKGNILIVEDDEFCRMTTEKAVKEYGGEISITTCSSVEAALEALNNSPCDLVISDYYLEGNGNGLDLCQYVVRRYPKTKCVMMSSMNFPQYQEVVSKADTSPAFMEKPIKPSLIKKYLTSFFDDLNT